MLPQITCCSDAFLGLAVSEYLFRNHPETPEGQFTEMMVPLVRNESLRAVAVKLELPRYMLLSAEPQRRWTVLRCCRLRQ